MSHSDHASELCTCEWTDAEILAATINQLAIELNSQKEG